MGCDIHLRVQKRVGSDWVFVEDQIPDKYSDKGHTRPDVWYSGRNYDLFGILAGVRNGRGFAGCDTGDGFIPIAEPRGLPEEFSSEYVDRVDQEDSDYDYQFWFGDHSHSWLTLAELLNYDWYQSTRSRGWVNGPQFEEWDRLKEWNPEPREYCGGVSGGSVTHVSEDEMRRLVTEIKKASPHWQAAADRLKELWSTYCQIEWPVFYSEAAGSFYTQTMPRMIRLAKEAGGPENVRIVFGFDS